MAVMMYARFPLSLRNVEDLLHELGLSSLLRGAQFRISFT
jgi:transposase-like protein